MIGKWPLGFEIWASIHSVLCRLTTTKLSRDPGSNLAAILQKLVGFQTNIPQCRQSLSSGFLHQNLRNHSGRKLVRETFIQSVSLIDKVSVIHSQQVK